MIALLCTIRFRPPIIKEIVHRVLVEFLEEKEYSPSQVESWTKELSELVKTRIKSELIIFTKPLYSYRHTIKVKDCIDINL